MARTVEPLTWFQKAAFLKARRVRVDPWDADRFEELVEEIYPFDDELRAGLVSMVRQRVASGWRFIMLDPELYFRVQEFLLRDRKGWRPKVAVRLWALLITRVTDEAGTIAATREELAAALSEPGALVRPDHVGQVMKVLVGINAARTWREGRTARYALNPVLATHGDEDARAYWQAKAGPILIAEAGELVRDPKPFTDPSQLLLFPDAPR